MMLADSLYGTLQDTSNIMRLTESSRVPRTEDIKTTRLEIDIGLSLWDSAGQIEYFVTH